MQVASITPLLKAVTEAFIHEKVFAMHRGKRVCTCCQMHLMQCCNSSVNRIGCPRICMCSFQVWNSVRSSSGAIETSDRSTPSPKEADEDPEQAIERLASGNGCGTFVT